MKALRSGILIVFFLTHGVAGSQIDSGLVAGFLFNGDFSDLKGAHTLTAQGGTFAEDRFGNDDFAYFIPGNYTDYINLGCGSDLKPLKGTISIWVNVQQMVFSGFGISHNPIIFTRSHAGEDCNEGYFLSYDFNLRKFSTCIALSELSQVKIYSANTAYFKRWYHLAMTFDDQWLSFYVDGELQSKTPKNWRSKYLGSDSVMIGNRSSKRNNRYFFGSVDDLRIYNRVLSQKEIQKLYNAPDPRRIRVIAKVVLAVMAFILFIAGLAYYVKKRIEKGIAREKEKLQLRNHWYEQESKVLSAQMDPHFIFNSLNTVQQFIISNDNENAQKYLSKFSRLIRKVIESNTRESISLKEETGILRKYIEIESLRFNDVFNSSISIGDGIDAEKVHIPHFLIQPFVENAIWHGLRAKPGNKNLTISFSRSGPRRLICIVEDNGVGRRNAARPGKETGKQKSLAINFIEQRLDVMSKMLEGKFGIEIVDKENAAGESEGTRVMITLPILKETDHVENDNN